MLFEQKMEPRCGYCKRGKLLEDGKVVCPKQGVLSPGSSCPAFRYDPLKRVPPRPEAPKLPGGSAEEFEL